MWLCILLISLDAVVPTVSRAQEQYKGISLPPYEFYEALVSYAEEKDFEKLGRAMRHLSPLFQAVQARFGSDVKAEMEGAVRQKNQRRALSSVFKLLLLDMRLNLDAARKAGPDEKSRMIEMAYLNYRFLSLRVMERNKNIDGAIKTAFKTAYRSSDQALVAEKIDFIVSSASGVFAEIGHERP